MVHASALSHKDTLQHDVFKRFEGKDRSKLAAGHAYQDGGPDLILLIFRGHMTTMSDTLSLTI